MNQPSDTPRISKSKNSPRSQSRRRFLRASGLIAAATGVELYAHRHEASHLVVETTEVAIPGWPAGRAPFRIGQLSDFHCDFPEALARTHHAVRMLLTQQPDIVVLTGDFVSGNHADKWIGPCADALAPLTAALPGRVFGVLGNHDWWCGGRRWIRRRLEHVGVHMLLNASAPIPDVPGCHLIGLDDPLSGAARPEKALRGVPAHDVKILLAHEPDYADELGPGFALQISGHSHGGQIRIPLLPPIQTPVMGRRYPEGLQQAKHHRVYTSRGIGTIGPPYRLFCPPEVTLLKIVAPSSSV